MAVEVKELKDLRAGIARASRRGQDPAVADRLRREYAERKLATVIEKAIANCPPLEPEQASRLAALLRSGGGHAT